MRARIGLGTATAAIITVLVLTVPGAVAAPAQPVNSSGPSTVLWAYGAFKTVTLTGKGTDSASGYQYTIHAYYGWQVVLSQTNISASVSEVEINRTVGLTFYAQYCRPNCNSAFANENVTILYHEHGAGFANLTNAATVYVDGAAVPAIGILNESAQSRSNYTDTTTAEIRGLLNTNSYNWDFAQESNGSAAIGFSPALGLYPTDLSNGTSWNATSEYSASGGWGNSWTYVANPLTGVPVSRTNSGSGAVARNGSLALLGTDLGDLTLNDGSVVQALSISVLGPFVVREGLLILPADADTLPSGTSAAPTPDSDGVQTYGNLSLAGNAVDVRVGAVPHAGVLASSAEFASGSTAPPASSTGSSTLQPEIAGPASDGPGTVSVQAEPESVPQAEQGTSCLASGTCPLGTTGAVAPGLRGLGILVIAVVVVGVLAAALVVGRRRTEPTPPHPNSHLYPAPSSSRPSGAPPPPRAPPAAEPDDPLSNLW